MRHWARPPRRATCWTGSGRATSRPASSLIALAQGRFVALARAMLRRYPHVRRWEETDDLLQAALDAAAPEPRRGPARGRPALRQPGGDPDPPGVDRPGPQLPRTRGARGQPPHRRHRPRRAGWPRSPTGRAGPSRWRSGRRSTRRSIGCPRRNARSWTCSGIGG